jgi:hypothetical protein
MSNSRKKGYHYYSPILLTLGEENDLVELSTEFIEKVLKLRKGRLLHCEVASSLKRAVRELFPDWVYLHEVWQTPGGRNDAILFESDGQSICFELFASRTQVDRDLLLLRDSAAMRKVAILLDREIDPRIAESYYRKRPHKPYPTIWLSEVLLAENKRVLQWKLAQYVLQDRLAGLLTISHQLQETAHKRVLDSWRLKGIDIFTGEAGGQVTFRGVMTLLVVRSLQDLGVGLAACEDSARCLNQSFDFVVRQVLLGIPVMLLWDGKESSILDLADYECWLLGAISELDGNRAVILLNKTYIDMKGLYRGSLPDAGDMVRMIKIMLEGRSLLARAEKPALASSDVEPS